MTHSPASIATVLLAATLLAGCATVPDYTAATLRVPARYGTQHAAPADPGDTLTLDATYPARDIAAEAWWQAFGDARLDRIVSRILTVNADLDKAALTLRKARLETGLARNAMWPQVSGNASASATRALDTGSTSQRDSGTGLSLSWEIDLWGRLSAARDVAAWEAMATSQDRESTALSLAAEACRQYWNLAYLNQSIAAGEANLAELARILALVQVQFQAGDVSLLNVREAQQNLESQRSAQSQLTQQRTEVRNALAVLLDGQAWPQGDEPQDLDHADSPALDAGIPAELLGRRPDLRAAELRLRKALSNIQATARSYYPALTLNGGVSTGGTSLADVIRNPLGTLGAGLALPFLNLQRMQLDIDIAGTDYEIAVSTFRSALYTALQEVNDALSARTTLTEQVEATQRSFDAARDIAGMYAVRYQAGESSLRTWLESQQTMRNAELALAQARRDRLRNDATLFLALGGGAG